MLHLALNDLSFLPPCKVSRRAGEECRPGQMTYKSGNSLGTVSAIILSIQFEVKGCEYNTATASEAVQGKKWLGTPYYIEALTLHWGSLIVPSASTSPGKRQKKRLLYHTCRVDHSNVTTTREPSGIGRMGRIVNVFTRSLKVTLPWDGWPCKNRCLGYAPPLPLGPVQDSWRLSKESQLSCSVGLERLRPLLPTSQPCVFTKHRVLPSNRTPLHDTWTFREAHSALALTEVIPPKKKIRTSKTLGSHQ